MKVTLRQSLPKRIEERMKTARVGISNAGPNAKTFWYGYYVALEEIKNLIK